MLDPLRDDAAPAPGRATRRPLALRWHRAAPVADGPAGSARLADAPTFLLVHGVGLSHRSLSRLAAVLRRSGEVLAPDLPGHAGSPRAVGRPTVEDLADAVGDGLAGRRRTSGPVVAVGHSLGSQVVVELARRRPDLVDAVVLVGPVVDVEAPTARGQARRLLRDLLVEPPLTTVMATRDYLRAGPVTYAAGVRSMLRHPTALRVPEVGVPVVVVRGARDPIAPGRWATGLASRAPGGAAHEVRGGHNTVHSHASAVAPVVLAVAARAGRSRAPGERS